MNIRYATYTNVGGRQRNEDHFAAGCTNARGYFVVADGLGGHGKGDVASELVCRTTEEQCLRLEACDKATVEKIFQTCQQALLAEQRSANVANQMRTTMNLLLLENGHCLAAHVGDSRTYYFEDAKLVSRSFDHSVPQMLVATGQLAERDIRFHEDRNRLLRVLGVDGMEVRCEFDLDMPLKVGAQFLLCSDGFWEYINETQMEICCDEAHNPQEWMENMLDLVWKNGREHAMDNITAITIWVEEA